MATFLSTPSARRATNVPVPEIYGTIISIHALREEGDPRSASPASRRLPFLSTPSARRATSCARPTGWTYLYFYPRPPRGGRPRGLTWALCEIIFLSTPSARRATPAARAAAQGRIISIHALREEGDRMQSAVRQRKDYFYPRPPRGGRLPVSGCSLHQPEFLSTPSARRATRSAFSWASSSLFLSTPSARRATFR